MANIYTDLLDSISATSSGGATNTGHTYSWSKIDPSSVGSVESLYGLDDNTLRSIGWNGGPFLLDNPIISYDGGEGGNQQTSTPHWSINPEFQKWMDANGYTYGQALVPGDKGGRGTALNAIIDKNGQIFGSPTGLSYDYGDSNFMKAASYIPAAVGAIGLGNASGLFGGGGAAGSGAGLESAVAADTAGGLIPEFGSTAVYDAALGSVPSSAATAGFMGAPEAVGGAGVASSISSASGAPIPSSGGAPAASTGTTWGIPNNLLGTGIAAGTSLLGGVLQNNANKDAIDAQLKAAAESNALLKYMYDTQRSDQAPWMEAGKAALGNLTNLLNSGELTSKFAGSFNTKFDPSTVQMDPGYQFGMDQGQKALQNSAAVRGMGLSGMALKDAQRFGNDYATTKYGDAYNRTYGRFQDEYSKQQDAFNRFYAEKSNTLNPLFQMSGLGQNATNQVQQAGTNYANQSGNNIMGAGNASAASNINRGNIYGNILANLGGLAYDYFNP